MLDAHFHEEVEEGKVNVTGHESISQTMCSHVHANTCAAKRVQMQFKAMSGAQVDTRTPTQITHRVTH